MPGVSTLVHKINAGPQLNDGSIKRVVQYPRGARSSACSVNLPPRPPHLVPVKSFVVIAAKTLAMCVKWSTSAHEICTCENKCLPRISAGLQ